jgi:hypothetical protein
MKRQISSIKLQSSPKAQAPNWRASEELILGVWNFSGAWMLALEGFPL